MIGRAERVLKQWVVILDSAVLIAAFLGSYFFRSHIHHFYSSDVIPGQVVFEPLFALDRYLWLLLIILPLWIGAISLSGGYQALRMKSHLQTAWLLLKSSVISLFLFGSFMFLLHSRYVSRSFTGFFFVNGFILLLLERIFLRACFQIASLRGYFRRNILVVGTGQRVRTVIDVVRAHADWGLKIIGLLDEDTQLVGKKIDGVEVIGSLEQLPQILKDRVIDEVIFVVPRSWMTRIEPALLQCELAGVRPIVAVDMFNMRFAKMHPTDLGGIPLLSFETTSTLEWQLGIKRAFDVLFSAAGLVLLSPVLLFITVLIKATSKGPVFFRQVRCGLNGRRFTLYKFRSMVMDAEAKQADMAHLNEMSGPVFKVTRDPRITSLGRWLRKTSLDELPQLINIFKGEMSLVGPRPPIPSEVNRYEPWQRRRLSMRPGLTGYWQVSGRNRIRDFNKWTELDLEYIDSWSLMLDTQILFKTVPTVLFGIGAK